MGQTDQMMVVRSHALSTCPTERQGPAAFRWPVIRAPLGLLGTDPSLFSGQESARNKAFFLLGPWDPGARTAQPETQEMPLIFPNDGILRNFWKDSWQKDFHCMGKMLTMFYEKKNYNVLWKKLGLSLYIHHDHKCIFLPNEMADIQLSWPAKWQLHTA